MALLPFVARGIIRKKQLRYFYRQISSSEGSKIKVCIVGSGPAGFYTAQHLLKKSDIEIDIFEKLPVPFGLIRYGVAPDHPEIKVVVNAFTKTALKDQCNFFGNITVGQDVSVAELLKAYNAVVLAYGANKDRPLGVPGEDSKNVLPARKFVGWYNGLPENIDENIDLDTEVAAVIGHGNVALDVARILLRSPEELKTTDITDHALEVLKKSRIRRVVLIGRRGPLQVAFTIKELREMTKLSGCRLIMNSADFEGLDEIVSTIPRPRKRLTELMLANVTSTESHSTDKECELRFFRSPIGIFPDANGRLEKIILGINKLDGVVDSAKVVATEEEEVLNCGLIVKSVGYQSSVIDPCVPFNQKKSVIPNEHGRVDGKHGLYCSGWVKTGPVGVILSTMNGSYETGEKLLYDLEKKDLPTDLRGGSKEILPLLRSRGVKVTNFADWIKIDEVEQEKGKISGKPREKICKENEMLQAAGIK